MRKRLARRGVTSVFSRGLRAEKLGRSSGVAVLFPQSFDVLRELRIERNSHRAVGAVVQVGKLQLQYWSIYGSDKDQLVTQQVLEDAVSASARDLPLLIGGDFNADTATVAGWLAASPSLSVMSSGKVTCHSPQATSEIDFFVGSVSLLHVMQQVEVAASAVATHAIVRGGLRVQGGALLTEWVRPKVPEVARVAGPRWHTASGQVQVLLREVSDWMHAAAPGGGVAVGSLGGVDGAQAFVDDTWQRWTRLAKEELEANCTGPFTDVGKPYLFREFDPCRQAAKGITRSKGVVAAPSATYVLAWSLRRVQEARALLASHTDEGIYLSLIHI